MSKDEVSMFRITSIRKLHPNISRTAHFVFVFENSHDQAEAFG